MEGRSTLDQYGLAAYSCSSDGRALEAVEGSLEVLRCPACGHRSDEPGRGVLGDAFDIAHRQWGLRGDPHAWSAIRALVGDTPSPPTRDAVRAAFIAALAQVADVDIDDDDGQYVYRKHLDHGGMSGGGISVEWWRTKGIPLLVDRAAARLPS